MITEHKCYTCSHQLTKIDYRAVYRCTLCGTDYDAQVRMLNMGYTEKDDPMYAPADAYQPSADPVVRAMDEMPPADAATDDRLAEIAARLGPIAVGEQRQGTTDAGWTFVEVDKGHRLGWDIEGTGKCCHQILGFIENAPADIAYLLAEVERLREREAEAIASHEQMRGWLEDGVKLAAKRIQLLAGVWCSVAGYLLETSVDPPQGELASALADAAEHLVEYQMMTIGMDIWRERNLAEAEQLRTDRDALAAKLDTSHRRSGELEGKLLDVYNERDALAAQVAAAREALRHIERGAEINRGYCIDCNSISAIAREALAALGGDDASTD